MISGFPNMHSGDDSSPAHEPVTSQSRNCSVVKSDGNTPDTEREISSSLCIWSNTNVASEKRCAPVELDHWLTTRREAQRSFDMVASDQEAGPFVLSTELGLLEMADHPRRERQVGQGVVRPTGEPRAAPLQEGESYQQTQQLALAERVTCYGASNVQVGCSLRSELNWTWVGGTGERGRPRFLGAKPAARVFVVASFKFMTKECGVPRGP